MNSTRLGSFSTALAQIVSPRAQLRRLGKIGLAVAVVAVVGTAVPVGAATAAPSSDFTVIRFVRAHLGDQGQGSFSPDETSAPFVGPDETFTFDCPGLNRNAPAVLLFESYDVTVARNRLLINGRDMTGDIRQSPVGRKWGANVVLVDANVLQASGNTLRLEARTDTGGTSGNRDDFIVDNLVIEYKRL